MTYMNHHGPISASSSSSTLVGSTPPSAPVPLSRSNTTQVSLTGTNIVKHGHAKVKEDGLRVWWSSKYLVLRENTLEFHKSESSTKISSSIQLRDVTGVSRVESPQFTFEVTRVANPSSTGSGLSIASRDLPQKTIMCQVKSDEETYDWIDSIYARCPGMGGVSNPTNFAHQIHVDFDPTSGAFVGLPPEWERLLTASAITKEDYKKNPQAVIEVLEFYSDITKWANNPDQYVGISPTPSIHPGQNKQQLAGPAGHATGPPPPPRGGSPMTVGGTSRFENLRVEQLRDGLGRSGEDGSLGYDSRRPSAAGASSWSSSSSPPPPPQRPQMTQVGSATNDFALAEHRRIEQEAHHRRRERDRQDFERDREQELEEQRAYHASLSKVRTPMAKQELGLFGGGGSDHDRTPSPSRYENPSNDPFGQGMDRSRQQPATGSLRQITAQRTAPAAPGTANGSAMAGRATPPSSSSSTGRSDLHTPHMQDSLRTRPKHERGPPSASNARYPPNGMGPSGQGLPSRFPPPDDIPNGTTTTTNTGQFQSLLRSPMPVGTPKPLNVAKQPTTGGAAAAAAAMNKTNGPSDAVKAAEAALTRKDPAQTREKDVRMSAMSEQEIMTKLKTVVSKDDPNLSYSKQKKIGQGASGSVYVAKVKENAMSPTAQAVLHSQGSKGQVAIKQMDLNNQPRKELIVNEIIVMKDSKHPNIVNFLDAFLRGNSTELWVVMEYMEGGALTEVIDNNPGISENQIATICLEVCGEGGGVYMERKEKENGSIFADMRLLRRARVWSIFIVRTSSIGISRATMFF